MTAHSRYHELLDYDEVKWGTHCVNCYPGNCLMRVYVKDGKIVREEQAGTFVPVEDGVPDFNPMGCMMGSCWHDSLTGPDRVAHPLKRVGERGEGKWERISWEQANAEIADAMLDAIENHGPRSIFREGSPETAVVGPTGRFFNVVGGFETDLNGSIGDFNPGVYLSYGKMAIDSSADDWFHSELILFWHANPVYTRIPFYHFISEARYNGAEVVNISPDINPSHTHADYQVTVNPASDAALGLALVQVMLDEDLADWTFIREQTDLSLLVRRDTGRFLRQSDLEAGGSEQQLYHWDGGPVPASRGDLRLAGKAVALVGDYTVTLLDGTEVTVSPVCAILTAQLDAAYTPEKQQAITGVHPDTIRSLARKIATRKTNIMLGMNACKLYHGDLIERTMCLVLAVSGNWGKQGTGIRCWAAGLMDGSMLSMGKTAPGAQAAIQILESRENGLAAMKAADPTLTTELAVLEMTKGQRGMLGAGTEPDPDAPAAPASIPAFWQYFHAGFRDRWNTPEWNDTTMARSFDDYFTEAREKGWWAGLDHPRQDEAPKVLIECGGNLLRRTRGGKKALFETLWPKLETIVSIDFRMTQTASHADYFLPAAQHYEKIGFAISSPQVMNLTLGDKAVEPAGEAKEEWQIFAGLLEAIAERAKARGLTDYADPQGKTRRYEDLLAAYTMGGYYKDQQTVADEQIRDSVIAGTLPEGTTLETLRETGYVRFVDWGMMPGALSQASPLHADKTHTPFVNHVRDGAPFPTYCRRAQFYIDHPWFLEAGEALPVHKPNPAMGGDYPLGLTSGHNRWSIHSMNHLNQTVLGTHRGTPNVIVNPDDARERNVEDDDLVRVFNDVGEFVCHVKTASGVPRGQIVSYNGWEALQYPEWRGANEIEPGMIKWTGLSGGYGHLNYSFLGWQPAPVDRWVRCEFAPVRS